MDEIRPVPESEDLSWLRQALAGVFEVQDVTSGLASGKAMRIRGRLLVPAAQAYAHLAPLAAEHGKTLLLRRQDDQDVIVCLDWAIQPEPEKVWVPVLLGVLTAISVLASYMLNFVMPELSWSAFWAGLDEGVLFTVALLAILLAHELGHYFVARRLGVPVSPPYLIPLPFSPFGTMGAVIRMKGIPPSKRAMLLTGAAGPICGLLVCLPVLIVGLTLSPVEPLPQAGSYIVEGNSLLYATLKFLVKGQWLPGNGVDLFMHPLAFAGWVGILVTGFNLIPAGQLDGGHVAYAWLGSKARLLTWGVAAALMLMGTLWPGWILWAFLIVLLGRGQQEPLESITPLTRQEVALAVLVLCLFVLTFTPVPLRYVS